MVNGKQTFARFSNEELYITKEEAVFAHRQGYEIHLLEAVVCEHTSNVYLEMITWAYEKRRELKRQMKDVEALIERLESQEKTPFNEDAVRHQIDEAREKWARLNTAQETMKVLLNSTYGKLGWSREHDVSNYVTYDTEFLLK